MDYLKRIWLSLGALALALMIAAPLLAQQGTGPVPTGAGSYGPAMGSQGAHIIWSGGPPPSLNAACGTGPISPVGTDSAFNFTSGTGSAATCAVTFAAPWNNPPTCSLDNQGTGGNAYQVSVTGIVFSGVADSTKYHVQCIGRAGG